VRHKNATAHSRFRERFSRKQLRVAAVEHLKTLSHRHHCQRMQIVSSVQKSVKNFLREYSALRPRSNSYRNSWQQPSKLKAFAEYARARSRKR